ncbi:thrombospondin type 3 repeat-containing protein [Pseudoalteromonas sp. SMS1]|uniref:thrombospondin type 3 repeat-containing protein n=1 Tax=Pseudoalteromonas sp. SMS1 TaxID=2908894 RepID=UPI001F162C43|nr:thrombospondin type 3 repeat-containing protein [Pseudoalteromonas sp. SMS1]MCF2857254.1 thrombospondin type 3 repeat-containing protein [Pseudoalteromonas sp. SMS1]
MRFKLLAAIVLYWLLFSVVSAAELIHSSVKTSDVSTRSFIVAWSAPNDTQGTVHVYLDPKGEVPFDHAHNVRQFIYADNEHIKQVMHAQGLFRTRVHGLAPDTHYYFRIQQENTDGTSQSLPQSGPLFHVKTMARENVVLNDTLAAYIERKSEQSSQGSLVYFHFPDGAYPLSHIVGDSLPENMAAVSLSNVANNEQHIQLLQSNVKIKGHTASGLSNESYTLAENSKVGRLQVIPYPLYIDEVKDTDSDGIPDWYELENGLNIHVNDAALDLDKDGLSNFEEYTLGTNSNSTDTDGDGLSDYQEVKVAGVSATSADSDNDGLSDYEELSVYKTDALSADTDGDGFSDSEEIKQGFDPKDAQAHPPYSDADNDGVADRVDNCPALANPDQRNSDDDALGDACDDDDDNDGIKDYKDNAPFIANPEQTDSDADLVGDIVDNCPLHANPHQNDNDLDGLGDKCDTDDDNDTVLDYKQLGEPSDRALRLYDLRSVKSANLRFAKNAKAKLHFVKQALSDNQQFLLGEFDLSLHQYKAFPLTPEQKAVQGQLLVVLDADNCECVIVNQPHSQLTIETTEQTLAIRLPSHIPTQGKVLFMTASDGSAYSAYSSTDHTKLLNLLLAGSAFVADDNCQFTPNRDQLDSDSDGKGDACDITPQDLDGDGILNVSDNCPEVHNEDQHNIDGDAFGDACDHDIDGDGVENEIEINTLFTDPKNPYSWSNTITDGEADFDNDGVSNAQELAQGSNALIPNIRLIRGNNYVYFPVELLQQAKVSGLSHVLREHGDVSRIATIDISGNIEKEYSFDGEKWAGEDFNLTMHQALVVQSANQALIETTKDNICRPVDLKAGVNFTALPCSTATATAFEFLTEYGPDKVKSITAINTETGLHQTALFVDDEPAGEDFFLAVTEGYQVEVISPFTTKSHQVSKHGVSINNLEQLQVVSTSSVEVSGYIDTLSGLVMINGEAVEVVNGRFSLQDFTLQEGENRVVISGRDQNGSPIFYEFTIKYAEPPRISLVSHQQDQLVFAKAVTIAGRYDNATSITVNEVPANLQGEYFAAYPIELKAGDNTIKIVATGKYGVRSEEVISLRSQPRSVTLPAATNVDLDLLQSVMFDRVKEVKIPSHVTYYGKGQTLKAEYSAWNSIYPEMQQVGYLVSFRNVISEHVPGVRISFNTTSIDPKYGSEQFGVPIEVNNAFGTLKYSEEAWLNLTTIKEGGGAVMVVTSHQDGDEVSSSNTRFQGYVIEADALIYQGVSVPLDDGYFDMPITLEAGRNYLEFELIRQGNRSKETYRLDYYPQDSVDIKVTSHGHNQHVSGDEILLQGRVSEEGAVVKVNGQQAIMDGKLFSITLPITAGENWLTVMAQYQGSSTQYKLKVHQNHIRARYTNVVDRARLFTNWPTINIATNGELKRARINNGRWINAYGESDVSIAVEFYSEIKEGRNVLTTELEFTDGRIQKLQGIVHYDKRTLKLKVLQPDTVRASFTMDNALFSKAKTFRFDLGWVRSKRRGLFQAPVPDGASSRYGAYGHISNGKIVEDLGVDELNRRTVILEFEYEIFQRLVDVGDISDIANPISAFDEQDKVLHYQKFNYFAQYVDISEQPKVYIWNHAEQGKVYSTSTSVVASVANFIPSSAKLNGRGIRVQRSTLNNGFNEYLLLSGRVDASEKQYKLEVFNANGESISKEFRLEYTPFVYTLASGEVFNNNYLDEIITYYDPGNVWSQARINKNNDTVNMSSFIQTMSGQVNNDGIFIGDVRYGVETNAGGATVGAQRIHHYLNVPDNQSVIQHDRRYISFVDVLANTQVAPQIEVVSPQPNSETYFPVVDVQVKTPNDHFAKVYINGQLAEQSYSALAVSYDVETYQYVKMPIQIGENQVSIKAHSTLNDQVSERTYHFTRKEMPLPVFTVTSPRQSEVFKIYRAGDKNIVIEGTIDQSIPVNELTIDGKPVSQMSSGQFFHHADYSQGEHQIVISARNDAGKTEKVVRFSIEYGSPNLTIELPESLNQTTTNEYVFIMGSVEDYTASVTINGSAVQVDPEYGNFRLEYALNEGMNVIEIVAENDFGESQKTLNVNRVVATQSHISVARDASVDSEFDLVATVEAIAQTSRFRFREAQEAPWGVEVDFRYKTMKGTPRDTIVFMYNVWVRDSVQPGVYTVPMIVELLNSRGEVIYTGRVDIVVYVEVPRLILELDNLAQNQQIPTVRYTVTGSVSDSGATLLFDGIAVALDSQGRFAHELQLNEGYNQIEVTAATQHQEISQKYRVNVLVSELRLSVSSPEQGEALSSNTVTFSGTVNDPLANVTINGVAAQVSAQGQFSKQLNFFEGQHQATVRADNGYQVRSQLINFEVLPQPLTLTVSSPQDGSPNEDGRVVVTGHISHPTAKVKVNGVAVDVDDAGHFSKVINLFAGAHSVRISATYGGQSVKETRLIQVNSATPGNVIEVLKGSESSVRSLHIDMSDVQMSALKSYTYELSNMYTGIDFKMVNVYCSGNGGGFDFKFVVGETVTADSYATDLSIVMKDKANQVISTLVTPLMIKVVEAPIGLVVSTPKPNDVFNAERIIITGQVDEPLASVMVNGNAVSVRADGSFMTELTLADGVHTVTVEATNGTQREVVEVPVEIASNSSIEVVTLIEGQSKTIAIDVSADSQVMSQVRNLSSQFSEMPAGLSVQTSNASFVDQHTLRVNYELSASQVISAADVQFNIILRDAAQKEVFVHPVTLRINP